MRKAGRMPRVQETVRSGRRQEITDSRKGEKEEIMAMFKQQKAKIQEAMKPVNSVHAGMAYTERSVQSMAVELGGANPMVRFLALMLVAAGLLIALFASGICSALAEETAAPSQPEAAIPLQEETAIPCQVELLLAKDGMPLSEDGVTAVQPGDRIDIFATSPYGVAFIGTRYVVNGVKTDIVDTMGGAAVFICPKLESGTEFALRVEAVGANDTGEANTVTKTGWINYTLLVE